MAVQRKRQVIAAAQTASTAGDIADNVRRHAETVCLALKYQTTLVVFPELSLTGYEPALAADTAIVTCSPVVGPLQDLADEFDVAIIAGCPIRSEVCKPYLGAIVFRANEPILEYRKRHLHPGEEQYFIAGDDVCVFPLHSDQIGVAICADIEHPSHAAESRAHGATVYAAGVAMTPSGITGAERKMSCYASEHGLIAIMANYAAPTGGIAMAGRSAVWSERGELVARAGIDGECLVVAQPTPSGWNGRTIA